MDLEGRLRHHIFNIISKEIASLSVKENLSNKQQAGLFEI